MSSSSEPMSLDTIVRKAGLACSRINKTKSLIDTIASYNGYSLKNGFMQSHSHTPNLEMLSHLKNLKTDSKFF